jgi:hypothetical protein
MISARTLPGLRQLAMWWLAIAIAAGAGAAATPACALADDVTLGEEHPMDFSEHQAFLLTQDALRGDGVLFETSPSNRGLVTLWNDINQPVGIISSLVGNLPRYRYEVQVVPEGSTRSKILVNVHGQNVTEAQLEEYKASRKLKLFIQIDQLASAYPPPAETPTAGGVNFALLPNEDLKALAMRATGNADNRQAIARDNGLKSPTDVAPFQTIWVRNGLVKEGGASTAGSSAGH